MTYMIYDTISLTTYLVQDPTLHLEFLANYIAELSLLEYNLLSYPPSLIAASAVFLARYVLQPTKYPWVGGIIMLLFPYISL